MMEPVNPTLRANPGDRVRYYNYQWWDHDTLIFAMEKIGIKSAPYWKRDPVRVIHLPRQMGKMTTYFCHVSRTSCGGHGGKFEIVEEDLRDHPLQESFLPTKMKNRWTFALKPVHFKIGRPRKCFLKNPIINKDPCSPVTWDWCPNFLWWQLTF